MQHDKPTALWRRPADWRQPGGRSPRRLVWLLITLTVVAMLQSGLPADLLTGGPAWAQGQIINISDGQRVGKLTVAKGKSEALSVSEPFENVVVGDPAIAEVAPLTDQSLYLLGSEIGTTNLALYDAEGGLIAVIDVEVTYDVSGVREALAAALPGSRIQIRTIGGRIMLQGVVADAVMVDRAMEIARDFIGDDTVTNALSIASPQQVMLEVRILEASRNLGRELGVNWSAISNGFLFSTFTQAPLASPFGFLMSQFGVGNTDIDVLIEAMEQKGIARRLAEPNLTALSGQVARFHAGGEFPVTTLQVVTNPEGGVTTTPKVEFKKFGVLLGFTPTVLADGVINLKIEPEVSEIDFSLAVQGNPGLRKRTASTTVELRDGQSMAMAGLMQSNHNRSADQIPWLGDVPILGALFRSSGFQRDETELVVIVTPRLVLPVPPGIALQTPLDNLTASNDPELVLLGKLEVTKEHLHLIETGGNVKGPFGHMLDLPEVQTHVITK